MWQQPVYNRTRYDVEMKNSKAYINTSDLNRIESNIQYLADLLQCSVTIKKWEDGEFIYLSDFERIKNNLQILKSVYTVPFVSPTIPAVPYTLYSQWNDIEKIIYDIYSRFYSNKMAVYFCGEIYTGSRIGVI